MARLSCAMILTLAGTALLVGCQRSTYESGAGEPCVSELPTASPLWGYRAQPGISQYDSLDKERYLGEYTRPEGMGYDEEAYPRREVARDKAPVTQQYTNRSLLDDRHVPAEREEEIRLEARADTDRDGWREDRDDWWDD